MTLTVEMDALPCLLRVFSWEIQKKKGVSSLITVILELERGISTLAFSLRVRHVLNVLGLCSGKFTSETNIFSNRDSK